MARLGCEAVITTATAPLRHSTLKGQMPAHGERVWLRLGPAHGGHGEVMQAVFYAHPATPPYFREVGSIGGIIPVLDGDTWDSTEEVDS